MPRKPTGNAYESRGRWYARVTIAKGQRPSIALPTCTTEAEAEARAVLLAELAAQLRAAPHVPLDVARGLLERAAQRDGKALDAVRLAADALVRGDAAPKAAPMVSRTFREVAQLWTSGEIAAAYKDHVRPRLAAEADERNLRKHVYPVVGDVPIEAFNVEHAKAVMRSIADTYEASTRRLIFRLVSRVLSLAHWPLELIPANPLPPGFLPLPGAAKAMGSLYPDEDAALLASPAVPLSRRIYYGFLDREGMRASEAEAMTWSDLDLERGAVTLDENKTKDPRAWALSPGVANALQIWRSIRAASGADVGDDALVFVEDDGSQVPRTRRAGRFRQHLRAAGVTRPALFESSSSRRQIRAHDLRATFITIALANGRSEAWVADRTGHRSSDMINRYRRQARTFAELGLGDLRPLDEAIPEIAAEKGREGAKGGGKGGAARGGERAAAKSDVMSQASGLALGRPKTLQTDVQGARLYRCTAVLYPVRG